MRVMNVSQAVKIDGKLERLFGAQTCKCDTSGSEHSDLMQFGCKFLSKLVTLACICYFLCFKFKTKIIFFEAKNTNFGLKKRCWGIFKLLL